MPMAQALANSETYSLVIGLSRRYPLTHAFPPQLVAHHIVSQPLSFIINFSLRQVRVKANVMHVLHLIGYKKHTYWYKTALFMPPHGGISQRKITH
jgi:hypothetical protein